MNDVLYHFLFFTELLQKVQHHAFFLVLYLLCYKVQNQIHPLQEIIGLVFGSDMRENRLQAHLNRKLQAVGLVKVAELCGEFLQGSTEAGFEALLSLEGIFCHEVT